MECLEQKQYAGHAQISKLNQLNATAVHCKPGKKARKYAYSARSFGSYCKHSFSLEIKDGHCRHFAGAIAVSETLANYFKDHLMFQPKNFGR
jgi:RNase P subunit RPR2